jgi:hypothetical protein
VTEPVGVGLPLTVMVTERVRSVVTLAAAGVTATDGVVLTGSMGVLELTLLHPAAQRQAIVPIRNAAWRPAYFTAEILIEPL